jgi:predicted GH43/DUF377 family glycosyl hydrolase
MAWKKLGLIFRPDREIGWGRTHSTCPTPIQLDSGAWRVFFASRDAEQRSHVGWFDIDLDDPSRLLAVADRPLLAPGPTGHFDGNGIYATGAVRLGKDRLRLYTVGWNPGFRHPLFFAAIGAAESDDMGRTISWRSIAPILDRSEFDPAGVTGPWVLHDQGRFRMWYVSSLRWQDQPQLKSFYHIKYAESHDGLAWTRRGQVAIDFDDPTESNIARPCILPGPGGYEAWFSYERSQGYRIGHGRSKDGVAFERTRADAPVIEPSDLPFENQAVCHPVVVRHKGKRFMFYNGNRFGIDGVALAVETP